MVGLLACLLAPLSAVAQQAPQPLRLDGLTLGGVRSSVTEAWGAFDLTLTNSSDQDRQARVLFFYEGNEDLQFGRDVWVPARSSLQSWMLAGPVPSRSKGGTISRSIRYHFYDRTGGSSAWVRPTSEERYRSRDVLYHKRDVRDPYVAVITDPSGERGPQPGLIAHPPLYSDEVNGMIQSMRGAARLATPLAPEVRGRSLPLVPEAFEGIDHLVIASNRVAQDPVGLRAARQWLMRGGTVWVFLDHVELDSVAPLLGGVVDFHVIDRVSLATFRVAPRPEQRFSEPEQNHDRPVGFARVLLPSGEESRYVIDGWPIWFMRNVGRGRVVFLTLGPRGWTRLPEAKEKPLFPDFPTVPQPRAHLEQLSSLLHVASENDPFRPDALEAAFRQPLADEIGYSVLDRKTVAVVFGGFLGGALVLLVLLRQVRRREWLGWLSPAVALAAAAVFVVLGEQSRRSVAPTVAAGQVVEVAPGVEEASVRGVIASFRPESGPAEWGAEQGGLVEIDHGGTEGQTRGFLTSDLGQWKWDGLSLPAGLRQGSFRYTVPTDEPVRAVVTYGPDGLEGKLYAGPFRNVSDAILLTLGDLPPIPGQGYGLRPLAVSLKEDGSFRVTSKDALPPDRYLSGTLVTDRQIRRQQLYSQFLKKPPAHLFGRTFLLAWADPIDAHFRIQSGARQAGEALLIIPLEYRAPAAEARVTVPGPLVVYRRFRDGSPTRTTTDGMGELEQHLRFQLPAAALPLRVERARLTARVEAAAQVIVKAKDGGAFTEVYHAEGPDAITVEIDKPGLLSLDPEGGLHLSVGITDLLRGQKQKGVVERPWKIHYLELEVIGTRR